MKNILSTLLIVIFFPLLIIIWIIHDFYLFLKGKILCHVIKLKWFPRGKNMLFVYSDSPNWKGYIEKNIIPKIEKNAIIINWSERSQWNNKRQSLEVLVFKHWARVSSYSFNGKKKWRGEEFNPIAIVFIPWNKPEIFKFWQAFKNFKHGKDKTLKKIESDLFQKLNDK